MMLKLRNLTLLLFCLAAMIFNACKKKEKEQLHPFVDFTVSGANGIVPDTVTFTCNLNAPYI